MLDIKKSESCNQVVVEGLLKELECEQRKTADGRDYVTATLLIKVDQECGGKLVSSEVPVKMFSMKLKKDKTENAIYANIIKLKEDLVSLAAAENPADASRVSITSGKLKENSYVDKTTGALRTTFQIETNFVKKGRADETDKATFELTGVVCAINREVDREEQETGRLRVNLVVVGYNGVANVLEFFVESPKAVEWIESKWQDGDTVRVAGYINMSYKRIEYTEDLGFGEPIKKFRTESKRELIIQSGTPTGLDEEQSYDKDDIKNALGERKAVRDKKLEESKNKNKKSAGTPAVSDFGF